MSREAAKSMFFDRSNVMKAVNKQMRQVFSKFGAFVRRTAKGSIRQAAKGKLDKVKQARKTWMRARSPATKQIAFDLLLAAQAAASAPPGQPPRSVKGHLKKNIFFSYDPTQQSVVIGPAALGAAVAPRALEYGGRSITKTRSRNTTIVRVVTVRPHPYMGPAVAKEMKLLPRMWAQAPLRAG